ncbi:hypothetical protein BD324DRAFT_206404 [Kockovaella imperatae]|uniref:Zn(2)-C6 fungal-type domain-containing protein n=1 Tax=Kockovaella imperatae TaxID=4999 RepID=A0A1Y1U8P4_9TREE|nr:hypothetical protein BD324DRAFT_206404 [Kockovaella imperatae]ORX33857.1 hypothetical protein BD324DRAFT_206404 [Kockovaella imperatae]
MEDDLGHGHSSKGATNSSRKRSYTSESSSVEPEVSPLTKKRSSGKHKIKAGADDGGDGHGQRRATQACVRCRKQKLRCTGGSPCDRCVRSKNHCDFGRPSTSGTDAERRESSSATDVATARLEQLESSVASLLAGLAGAGGAISGHAQALASASYPNGTEILHPRFASGGSSSLGRHQRSHSPTVDRSHAGPSWPILPSPLQRHGHPSLLPQHPSASIAEELARSHVRFTTSPTHILGSSHDLSPSTYTDSFQSVDQYQDKKPLGTWTERKKAKSKAQEPAERLQAVTEQVYDPPFKALSYDPAVWDNREASRMNSPDRGSFTLSRDEPAGPPHYHDYRMLRIRATPLSMGIVDLREAEALFQFFIDHCHAFMPIVNVALDDVFNVIRSSPALFSSMLAIAARFYPRATERFSEMRRGKYPPLDPSVPRRLANLAEMHLAYTVLSKKFALSDVQAILLLAAWGLEADGAGPDAWIVTGHAARVARRVGVYKILAHANETAKKTKKGTDEWSKLEAFLPQWRTWLCWFGLDNFLSLGFGRPQSTYFESVEEDAFLQIRLEQPLPRPGSPGSVSMHGDIFIAGLVSLAQIGKDLTKWGLILANPERAKEDRKMRAWAQDKDLSLSAMFKELNGRLDEWSKLWVWTGSPYALYLGPSVRIARLQAEHLRLCLNSYALKAGADEDEEIGQCLKKALNAAMGTIQTHFESSQTDLALSFATDYITIALAQSAVFLIRISKAPEPVRKVVDVDLSVVAHYLKMSVDLLESADVTEIRLPTFLAKTIRDIASAAGMTALGPSAWDVEKSEKRLGQSPQAPGDGDSVLDHRESTGMSHRQDDPLGFGDMVSGGIHENGPSLGPGIGGSGIGQSAGPNAGGDTIPDYDSIFGSDRQLMDLGSLLGLPGDNGTLGQNQSFGSGDVFNFGSDGYMNEFGFAMGGLGEFGASGSMNGSNGLAGLGPLGPLGQMDLEGVDMRGMEGELDIRPDYRQDGA